ncbi:MAG: hypothetical protein P4L11_11965 [Geothrix sp.]|jgi:hypothetical protein|nr:hypothetical protein [Geothrix sp.]
MSLEQTIIDLTSRTPSGGTCWIGDIPFTVWYCSDYWEWVFRGVYYFDPQDLGEAIEAFVRQTAEASRPAIPLAEAPVEGAKARPGLARRKAHLVGTKGRPPGLAPKAHPRLAALPVGR